MDASALGDAMRVISEPTAVTVGTFDGVHLGHQFLLRQLKDLAQERGLKTCVVTFDRSPREFLAGDFTVGRLSTLGEKISLLREQGIDHIVPLSFTSQVACVSAKDFTLMLRDQLGMSLLVMGPSNRIGRGGGGTPETLTSLGEELGFEVAIAQAYEPGVSVSSTQIRRALQCGDVAKANLLLGRPYVVPGCMLRNTGARLELLVPQDRVLPQRGSFDAEIIADWTRFPALAHCQAPTPGEPYRTLGLTCELEPAGLLSAVSIQIHGLDRNVSTTSEFFPKLFLWS